MKVALVNPNRLRNPPVIPIGLEYVAHVVRNAGHDAALLDLCFVDDVGPAIDRFLADYQPDVVFLTIRNVDTVINAEAHFLLEEHRAIAQRIPPKLPLVVGGAGMPAMPREIATYLGADTAVVGPAETAAVRILDAIAARANLPPVVNGFNAAFDPALVPDRAVDVNYSTYYAAGGVAGFTSSYGCRSKCPYCIEARSPLLTRNPAAVAAEVRLLVSKGWTRMHLCDAEMNVSYPHALALCEAMTRTRASWMTYLRCKPIDAALAEALRLSGCELATITVNSVTDDPEGAARSVQLLKGQGLKVAVDLSCGLPGETLDAAKIMIAALDKARADHVGITTRFRVYPTTPLAKRILAEPAERRWTRGDPEFILPAVYCRLDPAEIGQWIQGLQGFDIDRGEAVNYQRLDQSSPK
jgi:radical SAM superfamily enzyme YgiQ (UPF0313 family)